MHRNCMTVNPRPGARRKRILAVQVASLPCLLLSCLWAPDTRLLMQSFLWAWRFLNGR